MSVTFCISESDLLLLDDYYTDMDKKDPQALAKILWDNGIDCKKHIVNVETNTHRNLLGLIVTCKRYRSFERTDSQWLQSGYCSLEALIASSNDKGFRKELCEMATVFRFIEE